ncbi:CHASE domain-containing protein [Luteimonas soli]|uniref:histidine kinase n=1 Tax=Luteimonas soli TaxID=1648966 RepID=A0ABV7XI93_9GAMM
MRLPHGMDLASLGARLRVPLHGYVLSLLALVASLLLVWLYWSSAQQRELKAAQAEFTAETDTVAELLRQRLASYELVARGGVSLFASVNLPSAGQWQGYVDALNIDARYPDMLGLGYAPYLDRAELQALQLEMRDAGQGFYVVRPGGVRSRYGPVVYLEPRTPANRAMIGEDMFADPQRHAAMASARDDNAVRMTGPVRLDAGTGGEVSGVVMYAPVYRFGIPATQSARRAALQGWIYAPLDVRAFTEAALRTTNQQVSLTIRDSAEAGGAVLYSDRASPGGDDKANGPEVFQRALPLELYGRSWELDFSADMQAALAERTPELRMTLVAGVIASLLLFGVALALARTESLAERKAALLAESYQRSELRFRNAMRFSAIGQALLDRGGVIVDANPALAAIFDTTTDELAGSVIGAHFIDAQDEARRSREFAAVAEGVFRTTRQWRSRAGELRHAQLTYAPVPGEIGQDVASLVQVEDITERVLAHAREQALNRTLEARVALRTRELTHANQELESFAYSVSHDLRAPLRTIEGFSRLLSERYADRIDDTGRDYLARVRNAAGRMDDLIGALLKMSRVSRSPLTLEPLDLGQIARDVVAELQASQPQRQVEVEIDPDLRAVGDAALVRNLLQNLLGNAWKFTSETTDARIVVGKDDDVRGGQLAFHVTDNGAGFQPEYAGKLFRPFQRLHNQEQFDGNGIGLASVKRIIERHGGTVSAEGRPGQGATFRFTLPREMPAAD